MGSDRLSALANHARQAGRRFGWAVAGFLVLVLVSLGTAAFATASFADDTDLQSGQIAATSTDGDVAWEYVLNSSGEAAITGYALPDGVTEINVPETLDGHRVGEVVDGVFANDARLAKVYFPPSVRSLGKALFKGCTNLETVSLAPMEELGLIPKQCFDGCTKLGSVSIPAGVYAINVEAFKGCTSLKTVEFPASGDLSRIESSAFSGCASLESVVFPAALDTIGQEAFADCARLSLIRFRGSDMTSIGTGAFERCFSLEEMHLPDRLSVLQDRAFADCSALKAVSFGLQIPSLISSDAFEGCNAIELMLFPTHGAAIDPSESDMEKAGWTKDMAYMTYYVTGSVDDVAINHIVPSSKHTAVTVPAKIGRRPVKRISAYAAKKRTLLTEVRFPSDTEVNHIGFEAFSGCIALRKIEIPATVTQIDAWAFKGCAFLSSVEFKTTSLDAIKSETFSGCRLLKEVTIPEGVETIEDHAFFNCLSLATVNLPDSLQNIQTQAFGCDEDSHMAIKTMRMPDSADSFYPPSDRDFFQSWIVNRERNTFKFQVTYGSYADSEWFEPHILGDPKLYPITLPESDREYVPVDIGENVGTEANPEYTTVLAYDQVENWTGGQVIPEVTATRWFRTTPVGSPHLTVTPVEGDDCTSVGIHHVKVTGNAPYFTGERILEFRIVAANVEDVQMEPVADCVWDDEKWEPDPVFYVRKDNPNYGFLSGAGESGKGTYKLVKGVDYEISRYKDNTEPGRATITITGKGNFQGKAEFGFNIVAHPLNQPPDYVATVEVADQTFTGEALTPTPDVVKLADRNGAFTDSLVLVEGQDYVVDAAGYKNNTDVGQATLRVKAADDSDYVSGFIDAHFNIVKPDYSVRFDANVPAGASTSCSGGMDDEGFAHDEAKALSKNGFALPGYDFDGWNTKADGTGTAYADGAEVQGLAESGVVVLYAQWSGKPYTIWYWSDDAGSQKHVQTAYFDRPGKLDVYSDRAFGWDSGGKTLRGWAGAGFGSFLKDGDDFCNLCGAPDADGNVADPVIVADWVQGGQIIVTVTKDGVPQGGLADDLVLVQGGTTFKVPVAYADGKYVFDPLSVPGLGGSVAQLPPGEYDIQFSTFGYPPASARITYGEEFAVSVVFDYYTVSLTKDLAHADFNEVEISGGEDNTVIARDGDMLGIKTTVAQGYLFDNYSVVGVAPIWEGGDPSKANQAIEVQGTAAISAHVSPIEYSVTVEGGTADKATAAAGETVTIAADEPEAGKAFVQWAHVDGVDYGNASSASTTFTMPAKDVAITVVTAPIVVGAIEDKVYAGSPIEPVDEVKVSLDGVDLVLTAADYEVSFEDNLNVGDAKVIVTMKNPRAGSAVSTFKITPRPATITVKSAGKVQGEGDPSFTGTVKGLVAKGDLGKVSYKRTNDDEAPGTYLGVLTATYAANPNYDVKVVNGDFTITRSFTVIWLDGDGSVLQRKTYGEGDKPPAYDGKTPTKAATAQHTYAFAGWDNGTVSGTVTTYRPLFSETAIRHEEPQTETAERAETAETAETGGPSDGTIDGKGSGHHSGDKHESEGADSDSGIERIEDAEAPLAPGFDGMIAAFGGMAAFALFLVLFLLHRRRRDESEQSD